MHIDFNFFCLMLYFVYEFNNNNNTKILCACVIFGLELAAGFVRK